MNTEILNCPFEERFKLLECECDFRGRLTPGGLLRLVQQVATDQCTAIGMDDAFYRETRTAFLLAKQAVEVVCPPRRGETLTLSTQGTAPQRAVYKRITRLLGEDGTLRATVDSRWVLVNIENRRILRRPPESYPTGWVEDLPVDLEQSIHPPQTLEPAGEGRAEYSFCDTNGHLNNTRYADIACNALPPELLRTKQVRSFRLNYHREVPMGETFSLLRGKVDENSWYVTALREDKKVFEALLLLENLK